MAITVSIPTALRPYAGNQGDVELEGATVGELLTKLTDQYGELKRHLYKENGALRSFVNVYVNDDDMRYLDKEDTPVKEGDVVSIVPSVAGGAPAVIDEVQANGLTNDEVQRYSRHLILPEVGVVGQQRLKAAKVLLIGAGGLGSPLGLYLAAAGVGKLGVVDFDLVDFTNLHRQILHSTSDVGRSKLDSARETIAGINPGVEFEGYESMLTSDNALDIIRDYDIVVDGTDNFPTRYLVNDACVLLDKPNVYGSIFRFEGQASVFHAKQGPCYRCLYPEPPPPGLVPSCAEGGVLGVLPGIIGTIQAMETIKLIIGRGDSLVGRLVLFDAMKMKFREMKLRKDPECPLCGENPTITGLIDYEQFCGIGGPAEEEANPDMKEITPTDLKQKLDRGEPFVLVDVRNPEEYEICNLGGTLIPLSELPERLGELNKDDEIVVHCKLGGRSANAVAYMSDQGFTNVTNLEGGISAWADEVDPSMPQY
ncbi:MAG: molybdopterin-synthase adenylyltransferase MoeB [Verrucomicrobia bacterium]|nr:molybdopterin-synthase adenylyltransferase MoeB [Verrucomicrobiota bacterium]MDA1086291.1 molybdopterin-synthase adenylyltransferase MoeB [Verrucomicrobiota bacterium]